MKADKILYIEWIDSHAPRDSGWHVDDEVDEWMDSEWLIMDVGFLKKETKDMIYLVGGKSKDVEDYQGLQHREIAIPKGCIIKKKVLK